MKRPSLGFLLRIAISGALLGYVLYKVDWSEAGSLLTKTNLLYLLLSFAVGVALILISAWKWWILLRAQGRQLPLGRLFHLYLVGYFFNNVLPSNVGGDVIRAYEAGRQLDDRATALASVFVERFTGLTALILLAIVSFVSNLQLFRDVRFAAALGLAIVGYSLILVLVVSNRPMAILGRLLGRTPLRKLMGKLQKFQQAIQSYRNHSRQLWAAMAISFLFYLLAVINVFVSSLAFGTLVPVQSVLVIVPVILVISMIPISFGGVGLQEWAYFFTFAAIGAGGSLGLLVAILMRLKAVSYGVAGGALYLIRGTGKQIADELRSGRDRENAQRSASAAANALEVDGAARDALSFQAIAEDSGRSPLKKYQLVCIGNTKLWHLIRYEMLMLLVNDLPGLAGAALRRLLYKGLFKKFGGGVVLGRGLALRQPCKIEIGRGSVIDDRCSLSVRGSDDSWIRIGQGVFIGRDCTLNAREGTIEIEDHANLSSSIRIGSTSRIVIGKHTLIAAFCYIGGANHRIDRTDVPIAEQGTESKGGVVIEEDVWLAAGVIVNDGVRIGRGSVVGAGSVVTKDLPPYSIAYGVPAKVIKNRTGQPIE